MSGREMPMMLKSRWLGVAKGTVKGAHHIKQFFRRIKHRISPPEIVIRRTHLVKRDYREFDMYGYTIETNKIPYNYYYIFALFGSMFASYYIALSQYDEDIRYYLFIRFPQQMKFYDELSEDISSKLFQIQDDYVGEVPEVKTESDYYNFKKQVENKIFKTDEKEQQDKEQRQVLRESASTFDVSSESFDEIIKSQDKTIKKINHEKKE